MKYETGLVFTEALVPAEVFKQCQNCKSADVFEFDGDLFCNPCGWNSIEMRVEGQLSAMTARYRESVAKRTENSAAPPKKFSQADKIESQTIVQASVA